MIRSLCIYTLILAGFAAPAEAARQERGKAVAALDGEPVVSERDISDWQAAQSCYGEGAIVSRKAAFMRLLETAIAEKALKDAGAVKTGEGELRAEADRINRETRAPEILACVKRSIGEGGGYLRVFVRPVLIETGMRGFIANNPGLQAAPRKTIESAIKAVKDGAQMPEAARTSGLFYSTASYSAAASTATLNPGVVDRGFFEQYLSALVPGQVREEPVETEAGFIMARLLSDKNGEKIFEFASLPKPDQKAWLGSLPKMKIRIDDAELRSWTRTIKGNPRLAAAEIE